MNVAKSDPSRSANPAEPARRPPWNAPREEPRSGASRTPRGGRERTRGSPPPTAKSLNENQSVYKGSLTASRAAQGDLLGPETRRSRRRFACGPWAEILNAPPTASRAVVFAAFAHAAPSTSRAAEEEPQRRFRSRQAGNITKARRGRGPDQGRPPLAPFGPSLSPLFEAGNNVAPTCCANSLWVADRGRHARHWPGGAPTRPRPTWMHPRGLGRRCGPTPADSLDGVRWSATTVN